MLFIEHNQQSYFWLNKNFTYYVQYMFIIFVPHDCHPTLFLISCCYAQHKQYGGDYHVTCTVWPQAGAHGLLLQARKTPHHIVWKSQILRKENGGIRDE